MPVEGKLDQYRSHQEIEVKLPHEQMWKEEQMLPFQTPAEIEELDVFKLHPAYMALPDNEKQYARPVSIYLDAAKYTRRNNFWGIYIRNLRTRFEHLFAVFRKEDLCRCGCRGWDSFYPVFQVLVWSLNCGTAGDWPTRRHDDGEFQSPRDNWRSTRPSMGPMGIHLIVCELRGDWPAMNLILGNIKDGSFKQENLKISGLTSDVSGEVILGFRAEDAEVVTNSPNLSAQVFSFELLGDATMVTVKTDNQLISIKAKKDYRVNIGETIKVKIPSNKCHLFNVSSGESIMREVI